jgi:hypothetical protein
VLEAIFHPMLPTRKEETRKVVILLDLRVRVDMCLDLCNKLVNGACYLEAKCAREGNKVVLLLVR